MKQESFIAGKKIQTAIDPVCGMEVGIDSAKYMTNYKGENFYFCNVGCKEAFEKEPDKFLHK